MLGRTHVSVGLAAFTSLVPAFALSSLTPLSKANAQDLLDFGFTLGAVIIGSLAPDLDRPGSTLSREIAGPFGANRFMALVGGVGLLYFNNHFQIHPVLTLIGLVLLISAVIKHRGFTHSIFGALAVGYGIFMLQSNELYLEYIGVPILIPFMIGYLGHILADILAGGVYLFYPALKINVRIPFFAIRTGSIIDRYIINLGAFALALFNFIK